MYIKPHCPTGGAALRQMREEYRVRNSFKTADKLAFDGELGAVYSRGGTVFRVWSPPVERVQLRLYESGTAKAPFFSADMKRTDKGVWEYEKSGDLDGVYYAYSVTIKGRTRETADIYSASVSADMAAHSAVRTPPSAPSASCRATGASLASVSRAS